MKDFGIRLTDLLSQGSSINDVARQLNEEGFTGKDGGALSPWIVRERAKKLGLDTSRARRTVPAPKARFTQPAATGATNQQNTQSNQSNDGFAFNILSRSDWDSDKKLRLLYAYFDIET